MQRLMSKTWKAAPLPLDFHLALESGQWDAALAHYLRHPYHAPPVDTFELLKAVLFHTAASADIARQRFEAKVRLTLTTKRQAAVQVEWGSFWEALNHGDSRTISAALGGAKITAPSGQIAIAEACAALLRSQGRGWRQVLVEEVPFSTVTANNLVATAFTAGRWDIATEILQRVRISKGDAANLWPAVARCDWAVGLVFIGSCSKNSISFDVTIPSILERGCDLDHLSQSLERTRMLNDPAAVVPLLTFAVARGRWDYANRALDHLVDIGAMQGANRRMVGALSDRHGLAAVAEALAGRGIQLHDATVEVLEELRL